MQILLIRSPISSAISNFGSKLSALTTRQKQISLIAIGIILATFTAIWAIRRYFNKPVVAAPSSPAVNSIQGPAKGETKEEISAAPSTTSIVETKTASIATTSTTSAPAKQSTPEEGLAARVDVVASFSMVISSAPLARLSEKERAWLEMSIAEFILPQTREKLKMEVSEYIDQENREGLLKLGCILFAGYWLRLVPSYDKLIRGRFSSSMTDLGRYIIETYDIFKGYLKSPDRYTLAGNIRSAYNLYKRILSKKKGEPVPDQSSAEDVVNMLMRNFTMSQKQLACEYIPEDLWQVIGEHNGEGFTEHHRIPLREEGQLEEVTITHGGGYHFVSEFLAGKSPGYRLERMELSPIRLGMQVHPVQVPRNRLEYYAGRASALNLDRPCILTAKIKACFLNKAPNSYEAGLEPQYVRYLKDVHIELLSNTKWIFEHI